MLQVDEGAILDWDYALERVPERPSGTIVMQNPIDFLKSELATAKKELRHDVAVDLVRLGVAAALGWLSAEDPDREGCDYKASIKNMG